MSAWLHPSPSPLAFTPRHTPRLHTSPSHLAFTPATRRSRHKGWPRPLYRTRLEDRKRGDKGRDVVDRLRWGWKGWDGMGWGEGWGWVRGWWRGWGRRRRRVREGREGWMGVGRQRAGVERKGQGKRGGVGREGGVRTRSSDTNPMVVADGIAICDHRRLGRTLITVRNRNSEERLASGPRLKWGV